MAFTYRNVQALMTSSHWHFIAPFYEVRFVCFTFASSPILPHRQTLYECAITKHTLAT